MTLKDLLELKENRSKKRGVFYSNDISELRVRVSKNTVLDIGNTIDCQGKFGVNVERYGKIVIRGCTDIYQIGEFGFPQERDVELDKTTTVERIGSSKYRIHNKKQSFFPIITYTEKGRLWIEPKKNTKIVCEGTNPYLCKVVGI